MKKGERGNDNQTKLFFFGLEKGLGIMRESEKGKRAGKEEEERKRGGREEERRKRGGREEEERTKSEGSVTQQLCKKRK